MKTKKATRLAICLATSLAVVLSTGMSPAAAPSERPATNVVSEAPDPEHDAKDYLRAFYFGTGPVVADLPELKKAADVSRSDAPEALAAQDLVIEHIEENNPGFIEDFAADVTSGKHLRVSEALHSGTEPLFDALEAVDPKFRRAGAGAVQPQACSAVLVCALTVVVAVNYGGGVNIALAVFVWVKIKGPNNTVVDQGSLIERRIVQQAVENLD